MKYINFSTRILFAISLLSCSSPKSLVGKYYSNFAIAGDFVEQITLRKDSSFEYLSRQHVLKKYVEGHYSISNSRLILHYEFLPLDTTVAVYLTTLGYPVEEDRKRWMASFPKSFFIRHNKLYSIDDEGKITRKAPTRPFSKRPQKKYYLKHIE